MALPIGILLRAGFRVGLRLIPRLRSLYLILAKQSLRNNIRRKSIIGAEYARRLAKPVMFKPTAKRLKRKLLRHVKEEGKFQANRPVRRFIKAARQAMKTKQTNAASVEKMLKRTTKARRSFLLTNLAIDATELGIGAKHVLGEEKLTVGKELEQRKKNIATKKEAIMLPARTKTTNDNTSSGGIVHVNGYMRDGYWVSGYTRSS